MSVLPASKSELLSFASSHVKTWGGAPTAIGLVAADITAADAALELATETAGNVIETRDAAKAATLADNNASSALRTLLASLVAKIKFKAESTNDPNIYVLAQIPPPAIPGPTPPPGQPTMLKVGLEPTGALTINWKASNGGASSVVYQIYRKLPTQSGGAVLTLVGTAGGSSKKFTDNTLPSGSSGVQYVVQGRRGAIDGPPSDVLTVTFGVGGDGSGFGYTLTPMDGSVKLAA